MNKQVKTITSNSLNRCYTGIASIINVWHENEAEMQNYCPYDTSLFDKKKLKGIGCSKFFHYNLKKYFSKESRD